MRATEALSALTWNYFHRQDEPDLWCAVAAHDSVPRFLLSGQWRFSGHRLDPETQPPGFNASVARQAEVMNGFYLFHFIASQAQVA